VLTPARAAAPDAASAGAGGPGPSVRAICDRFVAWQAPSGGISVERCRYHRPPLLRAPISYGQDLPWIVRALYAAYDAGGDDRYKAAADGYAVFFIASVHYSRAAFALGGALEPCFTQYREHNPGDDSLDEAAHALYRRLLEFRTENGNYINAGYGPLTGADGRLTVQRVTQPEADVAFSDDLSDVGRGLVGYHRHFQDSGALEHARGMAGYFLREHRPGTVEGVWSSALGTWLIGPRHASGFENLVDVYADQAGWGWSSYFVSLFLARLHDCAVDEALREAIRERCAASLRWTYDACQWDDGAVGMAGRDDKWLGQTALAVLLYLELARRQLLDGETRRAVYPKALQALSWLREMSAPERFPPDGYVPVTGRSRPLPGWNTTWQMAHVAEALLAAPGLQSLGAP
jgi:hypothetical protein